MTVVLDARAAKKAIARLPIDHRDSDCRTVDGLGVFVDSIRQVTE